MEYKTSLTFPSEPTGCLVKIKNIILFEGELEIKNFLGHMVDVCLMHIDHTKNEAYALMHSDEEVSHLLKLYKVILKNIIFLHSKERNLKRDIEIEILDKNEERTFWRDAKKNNMDFYICCNSAKK
ncbi:conserved Plasmodium protein, unknown function [Plasmodium gonderi]|uniref:RNA-binding protein n=1 Tax=Plasmodium gonderi TaxID=77519 RepID=A0A1Y1JAM6_PLAGO|nr:conserved Plasmodium protein, unknown function [Plasmodium gonderi]GAW79581.1 conserved Plasmodium protein, unknown function [Plasmodium gonderi]